MDDLDYFEILEVWAALKESKGSPELIAKIENTLSNSPIIAVYYNDVWRIRKEDFLRVVKQKGDNLHIIARTSSLYQTIVKVDQINESIKHLPILK